MEAPPPISDLNKYNQLMQKSMIDKIFFMDKVDANVFVDIGCADGTLIEFLARNFPEHDYLGYDNDKDMIYAATKKKIRVQEKNVCFTYDKKFFLEWIDHYKKDEQKICVILSSMIHEVYSYSRDVKKFMDWIFNEINPHFISIRDMAVSKTASRQSDPITVARVRQIFDSNKITEWESKWGSIDENWSLTHFFLTYRYTHNWERELNENYLPVTKEDMLELVPQNYFPTFIEHYTLPFLRREVKKDFGVELQERTHLKLILEKQ